MSRHRIIVRIKGGLGNQLFCYAAARRLAWINDAELVIDHQSGFARDHLFRRSYLLDRFAIPHRTVTPAEGLHPFERYRRALLKWTSRRKPFDSRRYLEQDRPDVDRRLLTLKVNGTLYLDGLWQSETYFRDIRSLLRDELRITPPIDRANRELCERIQGTSSVALHVRWFGTPEGGESSLNTPPDYYRRAIALMGERIASPHFFLFSDNPGAALEMLRGVKHPVTCVDHNHGDENACADLWLMTHCRHCIIANSTFSWWGAWLNRNPEKVVIAPKVWSCASKRTVNPAPVDWILL